MSDDRLRYLANRKAWPAIHRLLEESSDEVKEQLVTYRNGGGCTAVHRCAEKGAPAETVHALLQAGPRGYVNVKGNDDGTTPAIYATMYGRARVLRQLINAGADPNIRSYTGHTARSIAVDDNNPNCIAIIDDYAAAATYLMCNKRFDDFHIRQSLGRRSDQLHPRIVELAGSEERLVSNWTPSGEGLVRPEISGIFLHHLHGKEKGISRLILKFLVGPKEKAREGNAVPGV